MDRERWLIEQLQSGVKDHWLVYELCKSRGYDLAPLTSAERMAYLRKLLPWADIDVIREGLEEYEHSEWPRVQRQELEMLKRQRRVEAAGEW